MDLNVYLLLQKPAYQALFFLLLTPILIFVTQPKSADGAWLIAVYAFVLFMIINAILLWFNDTWRYFFYSIGFAIGYILIIAVMMPGVLKILQLKGSGESAMAFLLLIYQPFALLLVMAVKWIVTKWL